jgi:hypothetical protein
MNQTPLFDLTDAIQAVVAAGLEISTASFATVGSTSDSLGQVDYDDYQLVNGLQNIPSMLSVHSPYRPDASAVLRTPAEFDKLGRRHLLLNGYYPSATQDMIVFVDGARYQVTAVEHDSQHTMTRCAVQFYKVAAS